MHAGAEVHVAGPPRVCRRLASVGPADPRVDARRASVRWFSNNLPRVDELACIWLGCARVHWLQTPCVFNTRLAGIHGLGGASVSTGRPDLRGRHDATGRRETQNDEKAEAHVNSRKGGWLSKPCAVVGKRMQT